MSATLESLELRRLLSAAIVNNVLLVSGTAHDDHIEVSIVQPPDSNGAVSVSVKINHSQVQNLFSPVPLSKAFVDGNAGDDFITVNNDPVVPLWISGQGGNDWIKVNTTATPGLAGPRWDNGSTRIYGGEGDDTLIGGNGWDAIRGGPGNDSISGGALTDFLYGDDGNDTIFGGAGSDRMFGNAGDDVLRGNAGDDKLTGNLGLDCLFGNTGNDLLYAGPFSTNTPDTLVGGVGRDRFSDMSKAVDYNADADFNTIPGDVWANQ